MFPLKRYAALLIPCFSVALLCEAKNLGTVGMTWPIGESDLFAHIANKLENFEKSGYLVETNKNFIATVNATIERPPRVSGIKRTNVPRVFFHDPSVTLTKDIITPNGQILAKRGDQFNPLDFTPMNQILLFFNGNDREQVVWALKQIRGAMLNQHVSPILIDGPVLELSKQWERQVYFDQKGVLTSKFEIRQVPARVLRDGNLLRIEEVIP